MSGAFDVNRCEGLFGSHDLRGSSDWTTGYGQCFEGLLPPVVAAPVFAIRKPAVDIAAPDLDFSSMQTRTQGQANLFGCGRKCQRTTYGATGSIVRWRECRQQCT